MKDMSSLVTIVLLVTILIMNVISLSVSLSQSLLYNRLTQTGPKYTPDVNTGLLSKTPVCMEIESKLRSAVFRHGRDGAKTELNSFVSSDCVSREFKDVITGLGTDMGQNSPGVGLNSANASWVCEIDIGWWAEYFECWRENIGCGDRPCNV